MGKKRKIITIILIAIFAVINCCNFLSVPAQADTAEQIQNHIDDYNKKLQDAQKELTTLQSQQYKNQTQINTTNALIKNLTVNIAGKEAGT